MTESPDPYAELSLAQLEEIRRRDSFTMTQDQLDELRSAITRASYREATPLSEERIRRLRGTTFDDPDWAPRVVGYTFPRQPQDRVRVLTEDGRQLVLVVRGAHRGEQAEFQYYQLQSPDDPELSWYLARDDGEPSWGKGVDLDTESVPAVGWLSKPRVPPAGVNPLVPPRLKVRVRPLRVDESGEEIRS